MPNLTCTRYLCIDLPDTPIRNLSLFDRSTWHSLKGPHSTLKATAITFKTCFNLYFVEDSKFQSRLQGAEMKVGKF